MSDWIFDLETYPNVFTIAFEHADAPLRIGFEVSCYRDDTTALLDFLHYLHARFARMVGFNNVGFDYPILHQLIKMGKGDAPTLYAKAQAIIDTQEFNRFEHLIKPSDYFLPQIDLYKINHFDNKARATSLKALEFNMRADSIEDLPFPVGTMLTREQVEVLKRYNAHDVAMTKAFYHHCKEAIAFREELTRKYPARDFMNFNDTKIGKEYFQLELEKAGVPLYDYGPKGRTPRQTKREVIHLRDAILPWIKFEHPELNRVLDWFKQQSITETKGVFKDITAKVDDFTFVFGLGGIHGSTENEIVESDEKHVILDLDVTSYYPNLAIKNGFYPEHLGHTFVAIYDRLFEQRKKYNKKSAESAMLKLALNGVYGDSGNPFSVFFDQLFTMRITLNGQLLLCMLAEQLMKVPGLRIIQVNTDGITVHVPRDQECGWQAYCKWWMNATKMNLEDVTYRRMCVADVNSYLAVREDGGVKRKGRYEWDIGWHQDASALVVPKVAEKVLVEGAPIRQTIENWPDLYDFMLRIKVPRSGYLQWGDARVQNTTRYIVTRGGESKPLTKWLPPTKTKPDKWRSFSVEAGRLVTVCNNIKDIESPVDIDYSYYIEAVEKLVMGLK